LYYGPKSTGAGWVELNTPEDALTVVKELTGKSIREQPFTVKMPTKNNVQRKIKREKKKKLNKKELPYAQELSQVQVKFKDSFQYISEEPPVIVTLSFKPSDPDFPFDMEKLDVSIEIPEDYPATPCTFNVMNADIPDKIKTKITNALLKRAQVAYKAKPMLLGLLKFLDNSIFHVD
jgi:hypothetical protein